MYKYAKSRNGALGQSVGSQLYQGAALIPGVASYNKWKSRGHMTRGEGYRTAQDRQI